MKNNYPIVSLIGCTNVGKSMLFNRLIGYNYSLVSNSDGLTRDKKCKIVLYKSNKIILIDTGGINYSIDNKLGSIIINKSLSIINDSDLILYLIDKKNELNKYDYRILKYLNKLKKNTFLIINKIDDKLHSSILNKYLIYSLKVKKYFFISALHNLKINYLKNEIFKHLFIENSSNKEKIFFENNEKKINDKLINNNYIKLILIGKPNSGKSTLINFLAKSDISIISDIPGTTRDTIDITIKLDNVIYTITDTIGINNNKIDILENVNLSKNKTLIEMKNSNIIIYIIDIMIGISKQDMNFINYIINIGIPLIIIYNKLDLFENKEKFNKVKFDLISKLNCFNFVKVHFISSLYGFGLSKLYKIIKKTLNNLNNKEINTYLLNKILFQATKNNKPSIINNYRPKLKYVHIISNKPLSIMIHGTRLNKISNVYKKYLINYFNKSLKIIGISIKINFKNSINPFLKSKF